MINVAYKKYILDIFKGGNTMNKYSKPKLEVIELNTSIIATPSSNDDNPLVDAGRNESWGSGIVEEFDFGD